MLNWTLAVAIMNEFAGLDKGLVKHLAVDGFIEGRTVVASWRRRTVPSPCSTGKCVDPEDHIAAEAQVQDKPSSLREKSPSRSEVQHDQWEALCAKVP